MIPGILLKIVVTLVTGFCLAIGFGYGTKAYAAMDRAAAKAVETVKARRFAQKQDFSAERPEWATPAPGFLQKLSAGNPPAGPVPQHS